LLVLNLRADRRHVSLVDRSFLLRSGSSTDPAVATVVADVRVVIDDNRLVIDVSYIGDVNVVHAPVVKEPVAVPISAIKTITGVSKPVIDTAIKSDMRPPISIVPGIDAIVPAPVARGPKHADGSEHPRARHPVVAIIVIPCPVAGSPDVAGSGTEWLNVNRQRWRTNPDRNSYPNLCR
jgi:hypothetical protein